MIELNEMHNKPKGNSSLFYKILKALLMMLNSIIMFYYLMGIVSYIVSGPSATLFDDLTTEFVIQIILLGLGLFYLMIAWFRHVSYSIVSIVFTFLYVLYSSILNGSILLGFLPIAMTCNALGFIILGIIRAHRKNRDFDVYAEPLIDELDGPDIINFRI